MNSPPPKTGSYPHEFLCRINCSACADYQRCNSTKTHHTTLYESRWLQPWFKYQLVSIQIATNTPCVFTEVTSISVLVGAYFLLRKRQLIGVLIKSDCCFKVKRTVQWNLCNPTPEFSDILWYPTKMYGAKVFLLTKIKPEYSDSLYNPTHFPWCVRLDRFHCISTVLIDCLLFNVKWTIIPLYWLLD